MKFNKLIPELSVSNFQKSLNFYINILGFKIEYQRKESKFAFISYNGSQLMIDGSGNTDWYKGKLGYPRGTGINFEIEIKNISALLASLKRHKYPIFIKLMENWYRKNNKLVGNKEFLVMDPDGYLLRFSQDIGIKKIN
jgi:catechol 2,3-dioxygenase-like lactoylglutathione lyase family enzyme